MELGYNHSLNLFLGASNNNELDTLSWTGGNVYEIFTIIHARIICHFFTNPLTQRKRAKGLGLEMAVALWCAFTKKKYFSKY